MPQEQFKSLSDNELLLLAASDEAAYSEIVSRYLGTVRRLAHVYLTNSSDCDDLMSEGIIGLMKAVKSYDFQKGASFSTYAYVCINNRMLTALKKTNRIISCEENIADVKLPENQSPESIVLNREEIDEVVSGIANNLSKTEKSVFELYMQGYTYSGIAQELGLDTKAVDNALLRVRRKLRRK